MKEGVDVFTNLVSKEKRVNQLKMLECSILSETLQNTEEFIVSLDT